MFSEKKALQLSLLLGLRGQICRDSRDRHLLRQIDGQGLIVNFICLRYEIRSVYLEVNYLCNLTYKIVENLSYPKDVLSR